MGSDAAGKLRADVLVHSLLDAAPGGARLRGDGRTQLTDVAYDTRQVRPGALFFCVPGARADGHDLAVQAVERGAVALVVERELAEIEVEQLIVGSTREAMGPIAARFFDDPSAGLPVLGITGTNGKTTTAFLAASILEADGRQTGLLGTVEQRIGGVSAATIRTTAEAPDLQRSFRQMLDGGDRACAMEVSSHAIAQHRIDGTRFAAVAFTNFTQDHIDFHGTMDAYFEAKARLLDGRAPRAVNVDDERIAALPHELSFGLSAGADVRAHDVVLDSDGTRFTLATPVGTRRVTTPLVGSFNVLNALAAATLAILIGLDLDPIEDGLRQARAVPGRMERVDGGQPYTVLVDYAHTPDALRVVLEAARSLVAPGARLVLVFGAGGDRDRGKRGQMGAVAARLADRVIVTNDNPRSEQPEEIASAILAGAGSTAEVELDRALAIGLAVTAAHPGDVLVIAGKGHEQGQETAGVKRAFDDRTVAREAIRSTSGGER